ncbi:MAG: hypothetical protein AAFN76_06150 [Pseudomonadota bacterium]
MLLKPMISLSLAAMAGLFLTLSAEAKPKFTVDNETWEDVRIEIYNGDDPLCKEDLKTKTVADDESGSFTCKGSGTGKCKVKIWVINPFGKDDSICRSKRNTCSGRAIKMKDGATLKITEEDVRGSNGERKVKYNCEIG